MSFELEANPLMPDTSVRREGRTRFFQPSVRLYLATAQTYQERYSCHSRVLQAVSSRPHRHRVQRLR